MSNVDDNKKEESEPKSYGSVIFCFGIAAFIVICIIWVLNARYEAHKESYLIAEQFIRDVGLEGEYLRWHYDNSSYILGITKNWEIFPDKGEIKKVPELNKFFIYCTPTDKLFLVTKIEYKENELSLQRIVIDGGRGDYLSPKVVKVEKQKKYVRSVINFVAFLLENGYQDEKNIVEVSANFWQQAEKYKLVTVEK